MNNTQWRYMERKYQHQGTQVVSVSLIGPGYYNQIGEGITIRVAEPTKVQGPVNIRDNGYDTIQITDTQDRMIARVSYYDKDITPEEALYIALKIQKSFEE